jgi:DNA-binding transcriptional MerR regulator
MDDDAARAPGPLRVRIRITFEELADAAGISTPSLGRLVRLGLVVPEDPATREFPAASVARLRRLLRLRRDLGLHLEDAALIAELVERIEELERELARLGAKS